MHLFWRFSRGQTLDIRVLARNDAGEILLMRPHDDAEWEIPRAFVASGESAMRAAQCALAACQSDVRHLRLLQLRRALDARSDQSAVYLACVTPSTSADNADLGRGFFPLGALPLETAHMTRRLIAELTVEISGRDP
jgi:hypothetical protein